MPYDPNSTDNYSKSKTKKKINLEKSIELNHILYPWFLRRF